MKNACFNKNCIFGVQFFMGGYDYVPITLRVWALNACFLVQNAISLKTRDVVKKPAYLKGKRVFQWKTPSCKWKTTCG